MTLPPSPSAAAAATAVPTGTPVASPCINICRMDAGSGLCSGCWRSLDEIAAWSRLSDAARREVWQLIAERKVAQGT